MRQPYDSHYKTLSEYLLPRAGKFVTSPNTKVAQGRWNNIYDSSAIRPVRILAAGMMSGLTSPARQWFRLTVPDKELLEYEPVKLWLHHLTQLMTEVFNGSNTYRMLHSLYEELGVFATAASPVVFDFENVINCHPQTVGQYAIAQNDRGVVDTFYRQYNMTVEQMVGQFGYNKVSRQVRNMYDRGSYDQMIPIIHGIEPRKRCDCTKADNKNFPIQSVYVEEGGDHREVLRESGYKLFPVLAPRWLLTGEDAYGSSCPGIEAIGDVKQLQHEQLRKAQGIDYMTKPPLQAPMSFANRGINSLPGGITFGDSNSPNGGIRTAWEVNLPLNYLLEDIADVRRRIDAAFYADMFLMLSNSTDHSKTATEVAKLYEEKMLMLGPVLERLHNEMLDKLIDMTFQYLIEDTDLVPTPPEEMQGMELRVELVSTLAQAQKAVGLNQMDRLLGTIASIAQFKPESVDKLDGDQWIDVASDMLGTDPSLLVGDKRVAMIRDERRKAEEQAQRMQAVQQMAPSANQFASAAKNLSEMEGAQMANTMQQFSGY